MILGLTGNIGSGKSLIANQLQLSGFHILDADQLGHRVLQAQQDTLVDQFGTSILDENGAIDRKKLGALVFADPQKLTMLNQCVHPPMLQIIESEINEARQQQQHFCVDAALIFEWEIESWFDFVICVYSPPTFQQQNLQQRGDIPQEQIQKRIAAQQAVVDKIEKADFLIYNDSSKDKLFAQLEHILATIQTVQASGNVFRKHFSQYQLQMQTPILATSIHSGTALAPHLGSYLHCSQQEKFYEEDPFTDTFAQLFDNYLIPYYSRFQIDCNRKRENAFYRGPQWGIDTWQENLPLFTEEFALSIYEQFYVDTAQLLHKLVDTFGFAILLDIHAFNYQGTHQTTKTGSGTFNPGTGPFRDHPQKMHLFSQLITNWQANIPFQVTVDHPFPGGNYSRFFDRQPHIWAIPLEIKKEYMDEKTGTIHKEKLHLIQQAVQQLQKDLIAPTFLKQLAANLL